MTGPVFVYYQLDNFYQNHRRYVKSRDYKQLMGETRTPTDVANTCDPIILNKDLANVGYTKSVNNKDLDPDAVAIPCGLIAKSYFNDTYLLSVQDGSTLKSTTTSGCKSKHNAV